MKNTYLFVIIQALLTMLLFFSQGYVKYITITLFVLTDLILFINLLTRKWSSEDVLTFAAIVCSGVFLLFFLTSRNTLTEIFGVALTLLFLVIAVLHFISRPILQTITSKNSKIFERINKPVSPELSEMYYDVEYDSRIQSSSKMQPSYTTQIKSNTLSSTLSENIPPRYVPATKPVEQKISIVTIKPVEQVKTSESKKSPEPVMHIKHDSKKDGLAAKAVMYELQKEAMQLQNVQDMMKDIEVYNAEKELIKEAHQLDDVQKRFDVIKSAKKQVVKTKALKAELKHEAKEIINVQKQINELNKLKALQDIAKQAKSLKNVEKKIEKVKKLGAANKIAQETNNLLNAQKKIIELEDKSRKVKELQKQADSLSKSDRQARELQFLNKQEKIVKQAKSIAKAQKEIDEMTKITKKSMDKKNSKIISPKSIKLKEIVKVKTVKTSDESLYFAADNGDKFHEPGCLSIKKVPKNKLTLYTSRKDAMRKGLKPCNVCIPR